MDHEDDSFRSRESPKKESALRQSRRTLALLLILFVCVPIASADDETAISLTLKEALQRAVSLNPSTRSVEAGVGVAKLEKKQLRASVLPHLGFNARSTINDRSVEFGTDQGSITILPEYDWRYEFKLTQPVYSGGRATRAIMQADLGIDDAREAARANRENILLTTTTDYLAVIRGGALVDVERKSVELALLRRDQAEAFYEAGESTRVDLLRADTAIKAAERRLAAAEQAREAAASRLRMDVAADVPIAVSPTSIDLPELAPRQSLIERAASRRPEIRRAQLLVRFNEIEISKQRRKYLPVVTSEASLVTQAADFPAGQYGSFTLNFDVPLFDSRDIASQIALARERKKQADLALEQVERAVREQIELALIDLRTVETTLALARDQLATAEAEYDQMFELYRAQEATSLDLESSETSLADARRAVATGEIDRDLAELAVWHAAGSLESILMTEEVQ